MIATLPVEAAWCREVLDLLAKSGLRRRVGWSRIRRETRTGSLSWIARRRRVDGSILECGWWVLERMGWAGFCWFGGGFALTSW